MSLPSNVPQYGSVDLIDFDQLEYCYAERPPTATLRAWSKFQETERRWAMFDWASFVIHEPGRCERMFRDLGTAYLMSFEAVLQILNEEAFAGDRFDAWLKTQPAYDLECRGLRTLRHLEAHIRSGHVLLQRDMASYSRFANSISGGTAARYWAPIQVSDFELLKHPRIRIAEIPEWNCRAEELLVVGLMRHGLAALRSLLLAGEDHFRAA